MIKKKFLRRGWSYGKKTYICKLKYIMELKFAEIGKSLGTRELGAKTRIMILQNWDVSERIVFDFDDVRVVTNSFADECFAKILEKKSLEEIQSRTTFVNMSDIVLTSIITAFNRRTSKV